MLDRFNQQDKRHENRTLSLLRRVIPGTYAGVEDLRHPLLSAIDLPLCDAIIAPPARGAMASLFKSAGVPVRTKPFDRVMINEGAPVLFIDAAFGEGTFDSLWCCFACDRVSEWFRAIEEHTSVKEGMSLVKHHRGQFVVALSGTTLKSIFKNATS